MTTQQEFNADPEAMVLLESAKMAWEATEIPGVSQKLLERVVDDEKGRETSLIKVDPGTTFPDDRLAQREEIFVLEGEIEDAHGVAGPGTWMRFPVGFRHAPFSHSEVCVMIVREGDVV